MMKTTNPPLWLLRLYRRNHRFSLRHGRRSRYVKLHNDFLDAMLAVFYGLRSPDPAMGVEAACCPPPASGRVRAAAARRRAAVGAADPLALLYARTAEYLFRQEGSRKSLGQLPRRHPLG